LQRVAIAPWEVVAGLVTCHDTPPFPGNALDTSLGPLAWFTDRVLCLMILS
jgi:hypothetical protein